MGLSETVVAIGNPKVCWSIILPTEISLSRWLLTLTHLLPRGQLHVWCLCVPNMFSLGIWDLWDLWDPGSEGAAGHFTWLWLWSLEGRRQGVRNGYMDGHWPDYRASLLFLNMDPLKGSPFHDGMTISRVAWFDHGTNWISPTKLGNPKHDQRDIRWIDLHFMSSLSFHTNSMKHNGVFMTPKTIIDGLGIKPLWPQWPW